MRIPRKFVELGEQILADAAAGELQEWAERRRMAEKTAKTAALLRGAEHKKRHEDLYAAFDELLADYLRHNRGKRPSTTTALEIMHWSHQQTIKPTEIQ